MFSSFGLNAPSAFKCPCDYTMIARSADSGGMSADSLESLIFFVLQVLCKNNLKVSSSRAGKRLPDLNLPTTVFHSGFETLW